MKESFRLMKFSLIAIVIFACTFTSTPGAQPAPAQPPAQVSVSAPPTTSPTQPAPPAVPVMQPGNYPQKIMSGGLARTYLLHVPTGYDGSQALPLVFVLHGFGGNAASMVKQTGFSEKADQENFFVAYLNGTQATDAAKGVTGTAWNNGLTPELNMTVDDVAFVRELANKLEGQLYVDSRRIYAAGFSNGAMMAHRLGAELSDVLAAVAVVEGTIGLAQPDGTFYTTPSPIGPIAMIIVHGKADPNVLYNGGQGTQGAGKLFSKSAADAVAFWTQADGCTGAPQEQTSGGGNVIAEDYTACAAGSEVLFYTVVNGEHEWPTSQGHTGFSATDAIWDFFSKHP
jgi:polyhydroxybutyrate depolymerase